jgi:hypothetical protein
MSFAQVEQCGSARARSGDATALAPAGLEAQAVARPSQVDDRLQTTANAETSTRRSARFLERRGHASCGEPHSLRIGSAPRIAAKRDFAKALLQEPASVAAIDGNRGPPRVRTAEAATVIMARTSASVRSTRRARCRYATDQRRRRSGPRTRARSSSDGRIHRWRVLREPGTRRMGVGGTARPVHQWCEGADDEPAHGAYGRARSGEGPSVPYLRFVYGLP